MTSIHVFDPPVAAAQAVVALRALPDRSLAVTSAWIRSTRKPSA
jgi:hypothetical protein